MASTDTASTTTTDATTTPSEDDMNQAAAEVDAAAATTGDDAKDEEPKSMGGLLKFMRKHSDGTNVMKESIKTFSNPDGSDKKGDLILPDVNESLAKLKELVETEKSTLLGSKNKKKQKKAAKWEFRSSPHEQFGKTLEDTFRAFVVWAKTKTNEEDDNDNNNNAGEGVSGYNVSKAFRRLESYAEWMEETENDLTEPALTADSCKTALDAWAMKCSISSKDGSFCWWIDLGAIDTKAVKKDVPPTDSLRAFVWYSHYVMYDENAQSNGIVFIENCAKCGFFEMMTMIPMKLGVKMDRLTIGVLPVKMKKMYILECPAWMDMMMKFMSLFMSKKMQSRIVVEKDWKAIEEAVGGKESVPKGFGKVEGALEMDPVETKYFSS